MLKRSLILATCFLAACAGKRPENPHLTTKQFADLPVPRSMELQTKLNQSYAYHRHSFRLGHFEYKGEMSLSSIESFLSERLPVHGWGLEKEERPSAKKLRFNYRRSTEEGTDSLLSVALERNGSRTKMIYDLRTIQKTTPPSRREAGK